MVISKAEERDLEGLSILFDNYRKFYRKTGDIAGARSFLKDRIENNESEIFIAKNDGQDIIGFVQLYPLFSSTRMKRYGC